MQALPGAQFESPSNATVSPWPTPTPPGVEGLCPIMVDSVMIVSVTVSMATSPMTGAARLMRMRSTLEKSSRPHPALSRASERALRTPRTFCVVPLMPEV